MRLAVITYNRPHKKTQDLLIKLITDDLIHVTVIAVTYIPRDPWKSLYQHRPGMNTNISTKRLCEKFGFEYIEDDKPIQRMEKEHIYVGLIGGCGIIEVNDNVKIINAHPGYLPYSRGLDGLKWAIYKGYPIGVTTHIINNEVDSGLLIEQQEILVSYYDTFHSVAYRQYRYEIEMLARSYNKKSTEKIRTDIKNIHGRMPVYLEPIMMERFYTLRKLGDYSRFLNDIK